MHLFCLYVLKRIVDLRGVPINASNIKVNPASDAACGTSALLWRNLNFKYSLNYSSTILRVSDWGH